MMAFLYEYGIFLAKAITIVLAIGVLILIIASARDKMPASKAGKIIVCNLNDELADIKDQMEDALFDEDSETEDQKEDSKIQDKKWWQFWKKKKPVEKTAPKKTIYVVDFDGDVEALEVHNLRHEITAILQTAKNEDEVVIRLTSPGGVVHGYGLCASQLARVKEAGISLTVAVDEVAASGGYLMACVADHIVAAPFSIVGSIGVVAQLPNFHKVLEKYNVDYEQFTAGKYKRTVTMFGENTDEAKDKFKQELEAVHHIFQNFITQYRPTLNLENVATGEHWLAIDAIKLGLVDQLMTSDSYLMQKQNTHRMLHVRYVEKTSVNQKFAKFFNKLVMRFIYSK